MKRFILFVSYFLVAMTFASANPEQVFETANQAYQANKFGEAITQYEAILADGYQSADLYYNLGNSYYKKKQLGKAVLSYERCLQLSPRHTDAWYNLDIVKEELKDEIESLPPFFLAQWWKNIHTLFSSTIWLFLTLLMLIAAVAGLSLWLIGTDRALKKRGFLAGSALLVLSLVALGLGNSQATLERDSGAAIILKAKIALRSAPEAESKTILQLHEGTKVYFLDKIGDWHKIRLANGDVGWLPQTSVEKI